MKTNMGKTDRMLRIVAALVIITLYLTGVLSGTITTVLLVIAAAFIITSFVGVCPLYLPFKINTQKKP